MNSGSFEHPVVLCREAATLEPGVSEDAYLVIPKPGFRQSQVDDPSPLPKFCVAFQQRLGQKQNPVRHFLNYNGGSKFRCRNSVYFVSALPLYTDSRPQTALMGPQSLAKTAAVEWGGNDWPRSNCKENRENGPLHSPNGA